MDYNISPMDQELTGGINWGLENKDAQMERCFAWLKGITISFTSRERNYSWEVYSAELRDIYFRGI